MPNCLISFPVPCHGISVPQLLYCVPTPNTVCRLGLPELSVHTSTAYFSYKKLLNYLVSLLLLCPNTFVSQPMYNLVLYYCWSWKAKNLRTVLAADYCSTSFAVALTLLTAPAAVSSLADRPATGLVVLRVYSCCRRTSEIHLVYQFLIFPHAVAEFGILHRDKFRWRYQNCILVL